MTTGNRKTTTERDGNAVGGKRRKVTRSSSGPAPEHAPHRARFALTRLDAGDRYSAARAALIAKFGISESTAERDLKAAYQAIADEHAAELPTIAARIAARAWRLAATAERARDVTAALAALALVAKVSGLASAAIEVTTTAADSLLASMRTRGEREAMHQALKMTNAQRQARIDHLRADPDLAELNHQGVPEAVVTAGRHVLPPTITDDEPDLDDAG